MSGARQKSPREILGNYLALAGILLMLASIVGVFVSLPFIGWPSLAVGTAMFLSAGVIRPKDAEGPVEEPDPAPAPEMATFTVSDRSGDHLPLVATFLEADPRVVDLATETTDMGATLNAACAPADLDDVIYSVSTMIRQERGEQAARDVTIAS